MHSIKKHLKAYCSLLNIYSTNIVMTKRLLIFLFLLLSIQSLQAKKVDITQTRYDIGENGAFPPTRNGCIHSLSMRERG